MKKLVLGFLGASLFGSLGAMAQPQNVVLTVAVDKPVAKIQPTMWGIFFEDINFAADGGIYAELVKNRSFEFLTPMMAWKEIKQGNAQGKVLIENRGTEKENNPRYARLSFDAGEGTYGLENEGFRGMGVKANDWYDFSVIARTQDGSSANASIELVTPDGKIIGETSVQLKGTDWGHFTASMQCKETCEKAHLRVLFKGNGGVDMDMVSLFPRDTWKGRPNGLRADLVQLLHDLKPGFLRFPGGCIVEGRDLANRYQWKNTVGNVEDRKLIINRWNTEFSWRSASDYFQSYGLGFYEYFQLSEDIGAEPLPIINCGMACQYNTGEVVPVEQLQPYIQDMLDLIEFANGDTTTKWGALRAKMGHSAPFNLKMLGVGNEQWDEQYIDRYKIIEKVLKEKYPSIRLVGSAGPSPDDDRFRYLWKEHEKLGTDYVDEHYYQSPDWFYKNATRYDAYDRKGPKVFAGEYASHTKGGEAPESRNCWEAALSEAALMTGLERNASVVYMASYAPLFAHIEAWQWNPNLIWFNNLKSIATPSYYVQQLFSNNRGTDVVPITCNGKSVTGTDSLFASSSIDAKTKVLVVKLVNAGSASKHVTIDAVGAKLAGKAAQVQVLSAGKLSDYNSFSNPTNVSPKSASAVCSAKKVELNADGRSFYLIKVSYK